jgi:hypothetical protein
MYGMQSLISSDIAMLPCFASRVIRGSSCVAGGVPSSSTEGSGWRPAARYAGGSISTQAGVPC